MGGYTSSCNVSLIFYLQFWCIPKFVLKYIIRYRLMDQFLPLYINIVIFESLFIDPHDSSVSHVLWFTELRDFFSPPLHLETRSSRGTVITSGGCHQFTQLSLIIFIRLSCRFFIYIFIFNSKIYIY